ncbi:MAG: hypothetical protein Q9180_003121 [Flavoplaca navasiana]
MQFPHPQADARHFQNGRLAVEYTIIIIAAGTAKASMEHAQGHKAETSTTLSRILPIIKLSPAISAFRP